MPHWSMVEMIMLGCITGAFIAFGATLFAVSTYVETSRKPKPLAVAVTPSRAAQHAAQR